MEIQPQLLLLEKTFLHIEGIGRQLYPQLDLWTTAKPFIERWLSEQLGLGALTTGLKKNLPYIAEHLPDIPQLAVKALQQVAGGELKLALKAQQIDELRREIRRANRRSVRAIIGSGLVVSASIVLGLDGLAPIMAGFEGWNPIFIGDSRWLVPLFSLVLFIPGFILLASSYVDED